MQVVQAAIWRKLFQLAVLSGNQVKRAFKALHYFHGATRLTVALSKRSLCLILDLSLNYLVLISATVVLEI
jgi:hypothetical protein